MGSILSGEFIEESAEHIILGSVNVGEVGNINSPFQYARTTEMVQDKDCPGSSRSTCRVGGRKLRTKQNLIPGLGTFVEILRQLYYRILTSMHARLNFEDFSIAVVYVCKYIDILFGGAAEDRSSNPID